jgi:hypothetical protein
MREQGGGTGSAWKQSGMVVRGQVAQTMYIHVSKIKKDKIKGERKKIDSYTWSFIMKFHVHIYYKWNWFIPSFLLFTLDSYL